MTIPSAISRMTGKKRPGLKKPREENRRSDLRSIRGAGNKQPSVAWIVASLVCLIALAARADTAAGSHQYIVKLKYAFMQPNASAQVPIQSLVPTLGGTVAYDWKDRIGV